jgi:cephalosporin hydroxylase
MNTGDLGVNGLRLHQRIRNLRFPSLTCIEVGVRDGVGSVLMLDATAGKASSYVIGIDASPCPPMLVRHPRYSFVQSDSCTELERLYVATPGFKCHAALCDSLHIAEQVMCETYFLFDMLRIGGFIAYHDTHWPEGKKDHYIGRNWDTPDVGIVKMFAEAEKAGLVDIEHFTESWGMTFVWKEADFDLHAALDWKPVFAGRNELLAILPESVAKREIMV